MADLRESSGNELPKFYYLKMKMVLLIKIQLKANFGQGQAGDKSRK